MRVPVIQPQTDLRPNAIVPARANQSALGAIGQGLEAIGDTGTKIAFNEADKFNAEQEKANKFRKDRALLNVRAFANDKAWGQDGFMLRQKENALDPSDHLKQIEEEIKRQGKDLPTNLQAPYMLQAESILEQSRSRFDQHSGTETQAVYKDIAEGSAQQSIDEAAANYDKPLDVESALGKALVDPDGSPGPFVRYLKDVQGLPAEAISQAVEKYKSKGYAAVMDKYLAAEDADGAVTYFGQVGDQIVGEDKKRLEKGIEAVVVKKTATTAATAALGAARTGEWSFVDPEKARENLKAAGIKNPAALAAADAMVDEGIREGIDEKERAAKALKNKVLNQYQQGHSVNGADFDELGRMDADRRQQVQNIMNGDADRWRRLREKKNGETADERNALIELRADVEDNPDKYADMTPEDYQDEWAHRLSPSGYKTGGVLLAGAKKKGQVDPREFALSVDAEMARQGITQAKDQKLFRSKAKEALDARGTETPLKRAELTEILDTATQDVVVEGVIWNSSKPRYKVRPGEKVVGEPEPAPRPTAKRPVKYRVSPDGTKRAPVFADGSVGPVESVP